MPRLAFVVTLTSVLYVLRYETEEAITNDMHGAADHQAAGGASGCHLRNGAFGQRQRFFEPADDSNQIA